MISSGDTPSATAEKKETKDGTSRSSVAKASVTATAALIEANATPNGATHASPPLSLDPAQPSWKKRWSGTQLNNYDHRKEQSCNSDAHEVEKNDEGGKRSCPFQRSFKDVLKKRRISQVSSKWCGGANGGNPVGGAFASAEIESAARATKNSAEVPSPLLSKSSSSVNNAASIFGSSANVSIFGSTIIGTTSNSGVVHAASKNGGGSSGFMGISSGFGALKPLSSANKTISGSDGDTNTPPPKSTSFGGGFRASVGFGAFKSCSTTCGFGFASNAEVASSTNNTSLMSCGSGFARMSPTSPPNASPFKFPSLTVVDTANGEQDEECLCQIRAKLFKMVPEDQTPAGAEGSNEADVPSVPSTTGRLELVKAKKEAKVVSSEKANESLDISRGLASARWEEATKPRMVQKEAGIGPVRVLKRKPPIMFEEQLQDTKNQPPSFRVVQRQETSGGQATKVILNIRLAPTTCTVIRRGDKYVQLNAPNSTGALESSLFKLKTTADGDLLEKNLEAVLRQDGKEKVCH